MPTRRRAYVLAVPRELRDAVPADWQTRVRALGGITTGPSAFPNRMQIEADAAALERIREEFGGVLRIEAKVQREPSG